MLPTAITIPETIRLWRAPRSRIMRLAHASHPASPDSIGTSGSYAPSFGKGLWGRVDYDEGPSDPITPGPKRAASCSRQSSGKSSDDARS